MTSQDAFEKQKRNAEKDELEKATKAKVRGWSTEDQRPSFTLNMVKDLTV